MIRGEVGRAARAIALTLLVIVCAQGTALAQAEGTRTPVPHRQIVSANPLGILFEWFNAEYERKIDNTKTWGVSGSFFDFGDADYRTASALFRYYPQEAALSAFFIGGRAGVHHAEDNFDNGGTFFSVGVDIGYTWLLGSKRNVGVSIGVGANRLFGGDLEGVDLTLPTLRLVNIGVAF